MKSAVGILGGAFDPIHHGHLRIAVEARQALNLAAVHLIPTALPPHKARASTTAAIRCEMLEAAIADAPGLQVDRQELARHALDGQPSYSINTLEALRERYPEQALCMIIGTDGLAGLQHWHRWQALFELAHLVVAERPNATPIAVDAAVATELAPRWTTNPADLQQSSAGKALRLAVTQLDISSTAIRQSLAAGHSARYLTPPAVLSLIEQHGLYTNA